MFLTTATGIVSEVGVSIINEMFGCNEVEMYGAERG